MTSFKTDYYVIEDGELNLQNLPFKKGENLVITIQESNDLNTAQKWRDNYLKRIRSISVWSEKHISEIEKAQQEINKWQIPE